MYHQTLHFIPLGNIKRQSPVPLVSVDFTFQKDFKPQDILVPVLMEECQAASWGGKNPGLGVYDFGQVL